MHFTYDKLTLFGNVAKGMLKNCMQVTPSGNSSVKCTQLSLILSLTELTNLDYTCSVITFMCVVFTHISKTFQTI